MSSIFYHTYTYEREHCMVRNYFLYGLAIAILVPSFINAAEQKAKPVILVAYLRNDVADFVPFIESIAEPNFEVKTKNGIAVNSSDLVGVVYALVYGEIESKKVPGQLSEDIKRFNNKGLVLFTEPGFPLLDIDPEVQKIFNDQIFHLNVRLGSKGFELIQNANSEEFKRMLRNTVLGRQPEVPMMHKPESNEAKLQQKIDKLTNDVGRLNQEVQRLNREVDEIIKQSKR